MNKESKQLKKTVVFVRCSKKRHTNCKPMQNALDKKFGNILHSSTTRAEINGKRYCVAAKAIVNEKNINRFEDEVWTVKTKAAKPSSVADVQLLVSV